MKDWAQRLPWQESGQTAFNIKEFLCAKVCAKACFCYNIISQFEGGFCRAHAVAAMCDIREGAAVDDGGRMLQRLHKVGLECVFQLISGLGGKVNGVPREDGFQITVASEIMAIFCLASDLKQLKEMLGRIIVGYTYDDEPVTAKQVGRQGGCLLL